MQRCPRAIEQPSNACLFIAGKPFVAPPLPPAKAPAYGRKCFLVLLGRNHKAHPFIHGTGLRPNHRQGPPCRSLDLLPMSPVYCVTYVAGLDHSSPLPLGEAQAASAAVFNMDAEAKLRLRRS